MLNKFGIVLALLLLAAVASPASAAKAKKAGKKDPIAKRFAKIDTNHDGGITLEELKAAHAKHHKKKEPKSAKADKPKKKKEAKAGKKVGKKGKKDKVPTKFAKMDANSDGKVTLSEFRTYKEAHKKKPEAKAVKAKKAKK